MDKNSARPDGFISIIALGIFALLMLFAISLQKTTMDTMNDIRDSRNHSEARSDASSALEYLQWKMMNHEAGWNTGEVICGFGGYTGETTTEGGGNTSFCQHPGLLALAKPLNGQAQKDIKMILEVRGHSTKSIKTSVCGKIAPGSCYVTPTPGTGTAGENCMLYEPDYTDSNPASEKVDDSLVNGNINLDQTNYSCNWNKLSLGSSQTDRVAIPLYYDSSGLADGSKIVNPYLTGTNPLAKNLIVRMRTPCKPCASKDETVDNSNADRLRSCDKVNNETVCEDTERYVLDAKTSDDIIVQWLINGECDAGGGKTEACGIIPIPKAESNSALFESRIYANNDPKSTILNYQVIDGQTLAYDINNYSSKNPTPIALINKPGIPVKLPTISKPVLTLFLNKPLWTEKKHNIPYLEYQVLTDQPISNNQTSLEAEAVVNGNSYKKILTKQVEKPLIDFAIHN